jgi:hypothetical protein
MTIKEACTSIGHVGLLELDGFKFPVKIMDVKQSYGSIRFLVSPVAGSGEKWVSADRVFMGGVV